MTDRQFKVDTLIKTVSILNFFFKFDIIIWTSHLVQATGMKLSRIFEEISCHVNSMGLPLNFFQEECSLISTQTTLTHSSCYLLWLHISKLFITFISKGLLIDNIACYLMTNLVITPILLLNSLYVENVYYTMLGVPIDGCKTLNRDSSSVKESRLEPIHYLAT